MRLLQFLKLAFVQLVGLAGLAVVLFALNRLAGPNAALLCGGVLLTTWSVLKSSFLE